MKKNIYFYWGNKTLSYMRYMTLYSFCQLNPDWTIYLIINNLPSDRTIAVNTKERQDKTEFMGKDYSKLMYDLPIKFIDFNASMLDLSYNAVYNMSDVHIKDLINWKLLSEGKGVVADMDILFISPLTPIINAETDIGLICFNGYPKKGYIPVSFMYASTETAFFKHTYYNALKNYNSEVYESCGTPSLEGLSISTIRSRYTDLIIQRFDDSVAFPLTAYPWFEGIKMLYEDDFSDKLPPNTVGIHWYGGNQLSQQFNNYIDEYSLNSVNNTITTKIKELLCQSLNSQ